MGCVTALALAILLSCYTYNGVLVEGFVMDSSRRFMKLHSHWPTWEVLPSLHPSTFDLDSPSRSRTDTICMSDEESEPFDRSTDEECDSDQETDNERPQVSENSEHVDSMESEQRRIARIRASQIAQRSAKRTIPKTKGSSRTDTSVGARRTGSATRARNGGRASGTLMDVLIKTARGVAAAGDEKKNSDIQNDDKEETGTGSVSAQLPSRLLPSVIQSAIDDLLWSPFDSTPASKPIDAIKVDLSAAFSSFEAAYVGTTRDPSALMPGSVLVESTGPADRTAVHIATGQDDFHIASLRLSVFSDFSPDLQNKFHARSCQALQSRRLRGAVCLVAKLADTPRAPTDVVLGSAECSFHEFFGTRLGQQRPQNSILYITEVAVHPAARRQGVGLKLLLAADQLANLRGVETLYLHVDVNNVAALALYEKAGYRKASCSDPIFSEFTRSLNLHPGATQGREHYLLYKDLKSPTWLSAQEWATQIYQQVPMGMLGFEIPA